MTLLKNGHTVFSPPNTGLFGAANVRFAAASDGFWVRQAPDPSLFGARLMSIDGMAVPDILARLATIFSVDNAAALNDETQRWLHAIEFLNIAGITRSPTQALYMLQGQSGVMMPIMLSAGPAADRLDALASVASPLWLTEPNRFYFFTTRAESRSVYVRYRRCANDPAQAFSDFFNQVGAAVAALPTPRVIVDLRRNPGGSSALLDDAINAFIQSGGRFSRLAVLIDNAVYSSAVINLYSLRNRLGGITFGAAPGTAPNAPGEVVSFTLPRSQLAYVTATRQFTLDARNNTDTYTPDFPIAYTTADMLAGRDPVLAAAEAWIVQ
jgi:hypothetical protein